MARKEPIILRLPVPGGRTDELATCAVGGAWIYDAIGLSHAIVELSGPKALGALVDKAGCDSQWAPGTSLSDALWSDAGWPDKGWLGRGEWERESIRGMEAGWSRTDGSRREKDWREGGWLWSAEHGSWMMQTFLMGSAKKDRGHSVAEMRLQPAALTFWQWDRDPLNESYGWRLAGHDLERMSRGMLAPGLDLLIKGLSHGFDAPAETMSRLAAWRDRSTLAGECVAAKEGQGSKRL